MQLINNLLGIYLIAFIFAGSGVLNCMVEQNTNNGLVSSLKQICAQKIYEQIKSKDFEFFTAENTDENILPTDIEQYIDSLDAIDATITSLIKKIYDVTDDKQTWKACAQEMYEDLISHYFSLAEELKFNRELLFPLEELSHETYTPEQIKICLRYYLNKKTDDQPQGNVLTSMLLSAIELNQTDLVRFLNGVGFQGEQCSPLYLAVTLESSMMVKVLIQGYEKCVEQESKETRASLMCTYLNGGECSFQTPLMAALQTENFEIVELLIKTAISQGCNLTDFLRYEEPVFGTTVFKILIDNNQVSYLKRFIEILKKHNADLVSCLSLGAPNDFEMSLPRAARKGNPKLIKFLINKLHEQNVDLNLYLNMLSPKGNPALLLLVRFGHNEAAKMLVKLAEKNNVYLRSCEQALALAQDKNNTEVIELLKQHSAKNWFSR